MHFDPHELRQKFEEQETEELLQLRQSGNLTDAAQVILGEVLAKRLDIVPPVSVVEKALIVAPLSPTEQVAQASWIRRTRGYFFWLPLIFLPTLGVRGIAWIVIGMFVFRVLATPIVEGVFGWHLEARQRNIFLGVIYLVYPVFLLIYVAALRATVGELKFF